MGDISNLTSQNYIYVKICANHSKYDSLIFTENGLYTNLKKLKTRELSNKVYLACGDCSIERKRIIYLNIDGILAHYLIQELIVSPNYRKLFIYKVRSVSGVNKIYFKLFPAKREIIDYSWNEKTVHLAWERVELDHALSWLSTLGGAFSALGDYFLNCALMAGKISYHQLKLALRLGDPTVASRCKLYFSLSLIQRGYLKSARKIIETEYLSAKNAIVVDNRLIRMCLGIWAKLKYEYSIRKCNNFL